jgi:hypothetical protein
MISPNDPSVPAGETVPFMAMGMYSDNSLQDLTNQVTWVSATTSVATISNATGSQGVATGVAVGTSNITATFDGVTGETKLTVTPAVLVSIAVTPANPTIAKGTTEQFDATGTYSDSSTQDLTSTVTWTSTKTAVATITATGLAKGVGTGTSTIDASLSGITGQRDHRLDQPHRECRYAGLHRRHSGQSEYLQGRI